MNQKTLSLVLVSVICVTPSCQPKRSETTGSTEEKKSSNAETNSLPNPIDSESRSKDHLIQPSESLDDLKASNSKHPTYIGLAKEFSMSQSLLHWPRTPEEEDANRRTIQEMLNRRKQLLFSIPISPQAEEDRNEAWDTLELGLDGQGGFFDTARNDYSKNLLNRYLKAPQLDQLVIWETVRTRLDSMSTGLKRGDATGEIFLRIELARLLFSALGAERKELFDAVNLKTRSASNEAETVASKAEEEIERIDMELSKAAEKILEQHWRRP